MPGIDAAMKPSRFPLCREVDIKIKQGQQVPGLFPDVSLLGQPTVFLLRRTRFKFPSRFEKMFRHGENSYHVQFRPRVVVGYGYLQAATKHCVRAERH